MKKLLLFLLGALFTRLAGAATDLPFPAIQQGAAPYVEPHHWALDPPRWFVSLRADAGYLYLKPRFALGYGKPFVTWFGLDVFPFVTPDNTGGYAGLRLQIEWLELRGGVRFVHSFARNYLAPAPAYDLITLSQNNGRPANYADIEAQVAAAIPAPKGFGTLLLLVGLESIQAVPANTYVFDETLRVVVNPPGVYHARVGYSFLLGKEKVAKLGVFGEVIEIPDRNAQVWRAGLIGSWTIDDHVELIATVLVPVVSPDSIGFLGADYTEIGVRYRWASGHHHGR